MKPTAYKWNLAALQAISPDQEKLTGPYANFDQINGNHPLRYAVPNGYIEYQARILKKSKVVYFNFQLAKEMGLIDKAHSSKLNKELERKLIDTFALRIINEYDQLNGIEFPQKEIKQNRYMATRYLQLQHSSKKGHTSGDGRSIWNGHFTSEAGIDWDLSSCGTGVTRLSPGSVVEGKPVKTGDKKISYGSGLADIDEGLTAAILSESFNHRGIITERTLLVIEGPDQRGINIRAAKNLLRPSHLFLHLKQGNQLMLKSALDFYLTKQIFNRDLPAATKEQNKYEIFLKKIAAQYAEFCAQLEDEYVFCWLDWDGDNMLMDGGIIDYGSIRQFGLCHHNYRYDDVDRFSTNLKEQKQKAKYLVQTFVQLVSFVETGVKKDLAQFSSSAFVDLFEKTFKEKRTDLLLKRVGLKPEHRKRLTKFRPDLVFEFERFYRYFERKESSRGVKNTADGVNNPAIFNARALLREIPKKLLVEGRELNGMEFLEMIRTPFLTQKEMKVLAKAKIISKFQKSYLKLLSFAHKNQPTKKALVESMMRSGQLNRSDLVTGDGIILVVDFLLRKRKKVSRSEFQKIVDAFIQFQKGEPATGKLKRESKKILQVLQKIVEDNSFSL